MGVFCFKKRDYLESLLLVNNQNGSHADCSNAKKSKPQNHIHVITGSVERFANRKELQAFIEARGGKATGSVTAKTSYLINNDVTSNSSKNKKAKELILY